MIPLRRWLRMSPPDQGLKQLSPHFHEREFISKGNGAIGPRGIASQLIMGLELLRAWTGRPIKVVSGYRDPAYNKKVGGAMNSQHLLGRAADVYFGRDEAYGQLLMAKARNVPVFKRGGIGFYKTFIHVDVRGEYGEDSARWSG